MSQKPPAWSNPEQTGQVPLMLSRDVDTTGVQPGSGADAYGLAEQIVRQNQPIINRFVAKQRQQIEIGGTAKDVHNAFLPMAGMDVYYTHVQGLERMHYHISPEAEAPVLPLEALEEPKIPPLVPEPEAPEIKLPEVPKIEVPKIEVPKIEVPEIKVEVPETKIPEAPLVRPLDPTQVVIDINLVGKFGILYSDSTGMYGSVDGSEWGPVISSVAAISVAWIGSSTIPPSNVPGVPGVPGVPVVPKLDQPDYGTWIAISASQAWRSTDGVKTWESIDVPANTGLSEVVAMEPGPGPDGKPQLGPDGKPLSGMFALWSGDPSGNGDNIHVSKDNGKSWLLARYFPYEPDGTSDTYESITNLDGCGGAFFVSTEKQPVADSHGDGNIYSSTDGLSFTGGLVFGPGNVGLGLSTNIGYYAVSVGYDDKSKTYFAIGMKITSDQSNPAVTTQDDALIGVMSASPFFSTVGDGTTYVTSHVDRLNAGGAFGNYMNALSTTGGSGDFVMAYFLNPAETQNQNIDMRAKFANSGVDNSFFNSGALGPGQGGSSAFIWGSCYLPQETQTTGTPPAKGSSGTFAIVAFDWFGKGGVFTTKPGGTFSLVHSGIGFMESSDGSFFSNQGAGLGVGMLHVSSASTSVDVSYNIPKDRIGIDASTGGPLGT